MVFSLFYSVVPLAPLYNSENLSSPEKGDPVPTGSHSHSPSQPRGNQEAFCLWAGLFWTFLVNGTSVWAFVFGEAVLKTKRSESRVSKRLFVHPCS